MLVQHCAATLSQFRLGREAVPMDVREKRQAEGNHPL